MGGRPGGPVAREFAPDLFREIMGCFPTGVAVVTALLDGQPRGLTVSSFCSVSLDPPLVLVCVDRGSNTLPALERSGSFTVNFLAHGRETLAATFASKAEDKFDDVRWAAPAHPGGGPILIADSSAHAVCTVTQALEAGDHWIFVGQVIEGGVRHDQPPLVYHRSTFVGLREL